MGSVLVPLRAKQLIDDVYVDPSGRVFTRASLQQTTSSKRSKAKPQQVQVDRKGENGRR